MKKKIALIFLIIFSHFFIFAENHKVIFYGPITSSSDISTTKLTSDLFYSQIQALPGYTLVDKRNITFQEKLIEENKEENTIIFYVEIHENGTNWECTITAIDPITKKILSKKDTYEGYYRILMEAKNSLIALLDDFFTTPNEVPQEIDTSIKNGNTNLTLDSISGTWQGDNLISKIVILRGGKGFVIYKNGASMNISVTIQGNVILAEQTSRANASFFPDLPREIALVVAGDAAPIKWNLSMIDENTLSGEKTTLMPKDNQAELQSINVTWTRVQ